MRADALRNRLKIIEAARRAFSDEGDGIPLEVIAARAGVGVGTFYRNFPNRDTLVVAIYQHEIESLCEAAPELLAANPADKALRAWADRFAEYLATKRAMGDALRSAMASNSPKFAGTRELLLGAVRSLLEAGARDGSLRGDVDPDDVMRLINGIWYLPAGPTWRADVGRMLDLIIDGLRFGVPQPSQP